MPICGFHYQRLSRPGVKKKVFQTQIRVPRYALPCYDLREPDSLSLEALKGILSQASVKVKALKSYLKGFEC